MHLAASQLIEVVLLLSTLWRKEEVDNSEKPESVEEDERSISKPETHTMPSIGVINKGHLVQKFLPIHTQRRIPP